MALFLVIMENFYINLSKENPKMEFQLDPENAYLELNYVGISHSDTNSNIGLKALVKITRVESSKVTFSTMDVLNLDKKTLTEIRNDFTLISDPNCEKVIVELEETQNVENVEIKFQIVLGRIPVIMESPLIEFDTFFNSRINSKILFSAPFGAGKSFFLDHYFNNLNQEKYNVFTLYPVNYSIASNEDIFKYIKADILLQLLARDLHFDQFELTFIQASEEFIFLKPEKAVLSFLDIISFLNPGIKILSKALNNLNELVQNIGEYKCKENVNDKASVIKYIKDVYEKEGSLFEDNFYTQLIRQLLEQLKETSSKPNVLIIEDLDRMDPDHIFRILNVISAHYDTFKFSDGTFIFNKFGFDKVIVVGDVSNIENIFHHKFGSMTDFRGYINKFFSSKPFIYDNNRQISFFIDQRFNVLSKNGNTESPFNQKLILILNLLNERNLISLRELLKLNIEDFNKYLVHRFSYDRIIRFGPYNATILYLKSHFGKNWLISKIEELKLLNGFLNPNLTGEAKILLASLGQKENGKNISIYKNSWFTFDFTEYHYFEAIRLVDNIKCFDLNTGEEKQVDLFLNANEFFDLLLENMKQLEVKQKE